ncbi:MAG: TatD family hydrolase [Candidatus Magasanikbacteria bacterium]|nr:TatD family hydrolase [Candidatus Magasanikbacteria bacterium]
MLIDSHCHVQFNAYKNDAEEVIRRSLEREVKMIVVGSQASTSKRAVEYARRYDGLWAVIGLHPIHLTLQEVDEEEINFHSREEKFDYNFYKKLAIDEKVVGIGEAGLDFFHLPKNLTLETVTEIQTETFEAQAELATELNLPMVIHCRDAHQTLLPILQKFYQNGKLQNRGVAHCFTGNWQEAKGYLDLGFNIGFTGVITFPAKKINPGPQLNLIEVVKNTPLNMILVETDSPYLAPQEHRGERCEPWMVIEVSKKIAEIKNISFEEVVKQTVKNTLNLFSKMKMSVS